MVHSNRTLLRPNSANGWLMAIGGTNAEILAKFDKPFCALNRSLVVQSVRPGDKCALYRGRTGNGFIGIHEVPAPISNVLTRVGVRTCGIELAWNALLICEDNPVHVALLAPKLSFIGNKRQYGTYLHTSLRRLDASDFLPIEKAVRAHGKRTSS
jgi:hypothetical protein